MTKWSDLTSEQKDELVAQTIGWQTKICDGELLEMSGGWVCSLCALNGVWERDDFDRFPSHNQLPPQYSTDMNVAWLLLQTIAALPNEPFEELWKKRVFMQEMGALLSDNPGYHDIDLALLATWTPENICLAILKAYEVEAGQ